MCMFSNYVPRRKKKETISPEEKARRKRKISVKNLIQHMSDAVPSEYQGWEQSQFIKTMFFEKVGKRQYKGYCECGATVDLESARSARKIECPACKKPVRLTKTKSNSLWYESYFALLDKFYDGWIQRLFVTTKHIWLENGAVNVKYARAEEERDFCDGKELWYFHPIFGRDEVWTEGVGRQHGMGGWYAWRICDRFLNTYPCNLSEIFKGSKYQYSAIEIATQKHFINPFWYLREYQKQPKLELLYKIGLYALAEEIYQDRYETRRIMETVKSLKDLGIDKKEEIAECRNLRAETLIARKEVKHWDIEKEVYNTALEFVERLNSRSGPDFRYSFITRERWFKYYLTQTEEYSNNLRYFISDYTDYISECTTLGLDLKNTAIKMPKSLKTSHKWAREEIKIQETQVYDALIEAAYENLHNLVEWSDNSFTVIMPKTSIEIVNEGVRQSHCVGRYCERVATGESIILFLRRKENPEMNFYTMEIKKDMGLLDVVQCRGYDNADKTEEVDKFLEKYARWFNHRSFGNYNSDNVMVKYFKAVHKKDGRYISNYDKKTEFKIGEWSNAELDKDSDKVAVKGLHVASMEFAQNFGEHWADVAILEVETNIHDVVIPDAKDQVRTSRFKVLREVPFEEMGEWGQKRLKKAA